MSEKRKYDSTVARIAGNIAGTMYIRYSGDIPKIAERSVLLARAIVAEVERTEAKPESIHEAMGTSENIIVLPRTPR